MKQQTLLFFIFFIPILIFAGSKSVSSGVKALKISNIIKLDGNLSETIWENPPLKEFTQRDPEEGMPASEQTNVWVAYDDNSIYIAAKLYDTNPKNIDASLARKDSWIDSDWFFFYVDPYLDKKTGYFFAVNPGGSIIDGTYYNDSWNDDSWDGIWEVKTSIDDEGWCVEMKIPFTQLRFKESDAMVWGINFQRQIKRKNEQSYYIMVPKNESGFVSHFAELEGLEGIKPKQRFEFLPYMVQKAQYLVHDADDPFYKGNQYKTALGADIKFGIGTNLNVDVTINPDFGQVEVDPAVVNLSAFETFFPEKRNFFIEGNNIFMYGIEGANNNWGFNFGWPTLFYSRRIGRSPQGDISDSDWSDVPGETRILGAAKLTGKIDETWSVGAVSALTQRTYATLDNAGARTEEEVEPFTHYGVLRAKKEFNEGKQGLGVMLTSVNRDLHTDALSETLSKNSFVAGLDGWTFLDEEEMYVISGAVTGSYVHGSKEFLNNLQKRSYRYLQRPDASYMPLDENRTSLSGIFTRVMLNKQKGNFYINAALGAVTPGFDHNDIGFQWMADRINGHLVLGYRWFEPDNIFRRKSVYVSHARSFNFDGKPTANFLWFNSNFEFFNYYGIGIGGNIQSAVYSPTLTRGGPLAIGPSEYVVWFNAYSDNRASIIGRVNGTYAKDGLGGVFYELGCNLEWKPDSQINLSFGPAYSNNDNFTQWIDNFEDHTATNTYETRYVFGRILQKTISANFRLNWTFTPTLSLQVFLQPLFAVGDYSEFKELAQPGTASYNTYGENGSTISYDKENDEYNVDPDGSGEADVFIFENPDFNFKSLRGNIVLRWEVLPGSVFYFVWSHDQINDNNPGNLNFTRDIKNLWKAEGNDVFLVKFSYWLDI